MKKQFKLFISGTGTDVGKTFITENLIYLLKAKGFTVSPYKPIETGCKKNKSKLIPSDASKFHKLIDKEIDIDLINQAKQIFQVETGRAYNETIDKIDGIEKEDESGINPQNIKTKEMKIPLNQIFYGPPGTGKTFIMSSKSEEIIQNNFNQSNNFFLGFIFQKNYLFSCR